MQAGGVANGSRKARWRDRRRRGGRLARATAAACAAMLLGAGQPARAAPESELLQQPAEAPQKAAASTPARRSPTSQRRPVSLRTALLAGGARLIAQTTIDHVDLEKLKESAVEKIRLANEKDYRRQMNAIFDDLEAAGIDEILGITRKSPRKAVIAAIQRSDRSSLLAEIRAIPDGSIATLVERKLREKGATSLVDARDYLVTEIAELVASLSG